MCLECESFKLFVVLTKTIRSYLGNEKMTAVLK